MSKEELFKKYQEIVLKTNGGADDYVVALCQISNLIKDYSEEKDQQIADLEAKLAESEKSKESYRLQNEQHHLQLLQFYSRLGVEAFGADIHEKALETLMIMKEQLAEKEKEIEYQESMKILAIENKNQKAIEQLEKVLVLIHNAVNIDNPEYDLVGLYDAVSNQIKQLKEGK